MRLKYFYLSLLGLCFVTPIKAVYECQMGDHHPRPLNLRPQNEREIQGQREQPRLQHVENRDQAQPMDRGHYPQEQPHEPTIHWRINGVYLCTTQGNVRLAQTAPLEQGHEGHHQDQELPAREALPVPPLEAIPLSTPVPALAGEDPAAGGQEAALLSPVHQQLMDQLIAKGAQATDDLLHRISSLSEEAVKAAVEKNFTPAHVQLVEHFVSEEGEVSEDLLASISSLPQKVAQFSVEKGGLVPSSSNPGRVVDRENLNVTYGTASNGILYKYTPTGRKFRVNNE